MAATMIASLSSNAIGSMTRGICAPSLPSFYSFQKSRRSPAAGERLRVRCQAEGKKPQDVEPTSIPPVQPKVIKSTPSFWDVLAFQGPAPERINGRLAMVGFVSAVAVELARGQDLAAQISDGGVLWFAGAVALLSAASLIPLFQGVDAAAL